jgi:hypothetical protein
MAKVVVSAGATLIADEATADMPTVCGAWIVFSLKAGVLVIGQRVIGQRVIGQRGIRS